MDKKTKQKIEFYIKSIHEKEQIAAERLKLWMPDKMAAIQLNFKEIKKKNIIERYKDDNSPASYCPYIESTITYKIGEQEITDTIEDMYFFNPKIFESSDEDLDNAFIHEAIHRLYFWNIAKKSNMTPRELIDFESNLIKKLSKSQDEEKAYQYFSKILREAYAIYGEMVITGEERLCPLFLLLKEDSQKEFIEKIRRGNIKEQEKIFERTLEAQARGEQDFIKKMAGEIYMSLVALMLYRDYGSDEEAVTKVRDLFIDYNLRVIRPEEFSPLERYMNLFRN